MNREQISRPSNNQKSKDIIRKSLIILALVFCLQTLQQSSTTRRLDDVSISNEEGLPIVHTFYQKLKEGEDDLLEAWKEEWTIAGFEARVLTLDDAKKHPYFEKMEKVVRPMFGNGYDAMCWYRWLAMAVVGGGWMSDYDTMPTNFPMDEAIHLPDGGKFTSFESHVPCLLSGSEDEWNRVSKLLVEAVPRISYSLKSDMHAFVLLKDEKTHDIDFRPARENIREGFPYLSKLEYLYPRKVDCKTMSEGRAIHLSHRYTKEAFDKGLFPLIQIESYQQAIMKRGKSARVFLSDWRDQCGGSNVK